MTDKQIAMVEKEIPYVDYMLRKLIPYIPEAYREDVRQTALLALCEFVYKEDPPGDELPRYAYRRVKRYVLQYLIGEDKYHKTIDANTVENELVEEGKPVDTLPIQDMAMSVLDPFSKYIDRDMQVCSLLFQGYKISEIAEKTGLTVSQIRSSRKRIQRGIEMQIGENAV